ncbi:MAG: AAA family ATPase [Deltaproteobacteria bacterium]|nr:AAA family ATPase [Deltaproteobacteria bacterium]
MARLLGIRIQNYRSLVDLHLGQTSYSTRRDESLSRLTCLIGPNGAGKSSVLDAFGFVADCLLDGVENACDKPGRGGFERLRSQGATGPIEFEVFFEDEDVDRPIVYRLSIGLVGEVPAVVEETLRQRQQGQTRGKPYYFLKLKEGSGKVWAGQSVGVKAGKKDEQKVRLADRDKLGITTLGNLSEHPRIVRLRQYIERWYLSYFVPEAARALPAAGAQRWLDRTGSNLGNVLQYFERQYAQEYDQILRRLAKAVPGLERITTEISKDGRLLLKFDEDGYADPFYQQSMSDGTLKMLAYAILLADPAPRPFIGIEEPENGLYVRLVDRLAAQFSLRASSTTSPTQLLLTTHSPYFVDALRAEQVFILKKERGCSVARRASEEPEIQALLDQGIPLGSLWYSNHFDDGAPE